jgi:hypothetical protein
VSSLTRLTVQTERCWSGVEEVELEEMRERETIPDAARSILVCLDGVMVSMLEELVGSVRRPAGWREASTGAVLLLDGDGGVLSSRYFGRLPEQGKRSLKRLLTAEVMHLRKRRPDLRLIAAADAAPDNWTSVLHCPLCCPRPGRSRLVAYNKLNSLLLFPKAWTSLFASGGVLTP